MRWTGWTGLAAGLLAVAGCGFGYRSVLLEARYSAQSRPHASYFCYDCHGYRYFDPYYDWCAGHGFRYLWRSQPQVVAIYRDRYVRIRESRPDYGRYRYPERYKETTRYREPRSYEAWRRASDRDRGRGEAVKPGRRDRPREKDDDRPGMKEGESRKGGRSGGRGPRDPRPGGGT